MEFKFIKFNPKENKAIRKGAPVYYGVKVIGEIIDVKVVGDKSIITIDVPSATFFFIPGTVSLTCRYDICRLKTVR